MQSGYLSLENAAFSLVLHFFKDIAVNQYDLPLPSDELSNDDSLMQLIEAIYYPTLLKNI